MNPGIFLIPYVLWLAWLAYKRKPLLLAVWIFGVVALPTVRNRVGPVSLYWGDLAAIAAVASFVFHRASLAPRPSMDRWFYVLFISLVFGGFTAFVRYGVWLQPGYTLYRTLLAMAPLLVLPRVFKYEVCVKQIAYGLAAGAVLVGGTGMLQASSPGMALRVQQFWYGDYLTASQSDKESSTVNFLVIAEQLTRYRSHGQYNVSTLYGGAAALSGILALLISMFLTKSRLRTVCYVAAAIAFFGSSLSYSRHSLLALLFFVAIVAVSNPTRIIRYGAVVALVVGLGGGLLSTEFWAQRIARGGITEDYNLAARLIIRPLELVDRIDREPSVALFGIGLELRQVSKRLLPPNYRYGFVSNSFLLYLFYCGLFAFIAHLAFFAWLALRAIRLRRPFSGVAFAAVFATCVIIASDNYAFFHLSIIGMWAFIAAIVLQMPVKATTRKKVRALTTSMPERPRREPVAARSPIDAQL